MIDFIREKMDEIEQAKRIIKQTHKAKKHAEQLLKREESGKAILILLRYIDTCEGVIKLYRKDLI